jgi:hypothetical protein
MKFLYFESAKVAILCHYLMHMTVCCRLIPRSILRIEMKTNMNASFATAISFDASPIDTDSGVVYAAMVLLGLYVLIVLEVSFIKYSVFDVKTCSEGHTEQQIFVRTNRFKICFYFRLYTELWQQ